MVVDVDVVVKNKFFHYKTYSYLYNIMKRFTQNTTWFHFCPQKGWKDLLYL